MYKTEERIIHRGQSRVAFAAVKVIHPPPQPCIDPPAGPFIPDWQSVSRGPALVAPFLTQAQIITPPPKIDPRTLTNKPDSGQRIYEYIQHQNLPNRDLILLGKEKKNKSALIQYIKTLPDREQKRVLDNALDKTTRLHFFFAVPRSFLFGTAPRRGSFAILRQLRTDLETRMAQFIPELLAEEHSKVGCSDPYATASAPYFNEAQEDAYTSDPKFHAMQC